MYYAQIRKFLEDQYCDPSVVITWLLPTIESLQGAFDPSTYIIGTASRGVCNMCNRVIITAITTGLSVCSSRNHDKGLMANRIALCFG